MPVGYTDYTYNALSESCRLWYYELPSIKHPDVDADQYEDNCGQNTPHMLYPCDKLKALDLWVNVTQVVKTTRFTMERMGYAMGPWFEFVKNG